ncbi:MAG: hypothetical protein JNL50_07970 [Phycisphaerae bacterium]|nr:hypothetical protein [Phycisphaerae bacterium]
MNTHPARSFLMLASALVLATSAECLAQTKWVGKSLHPEGARHSQGNASASGIQGGKYTLPDSISTFLPAIWRGNTQSVEILDPRPLGWWGGEVLGAHGIRQVGHLYSDTAGHAVAWSGSATTLVDLHPATGSYTSSTARYIFDNQAVGNVTKFGDDHAALWDISTGTFTDLHPRGARTSGAIATDGVRQGGAADFQSLNMGRALIWNSSPNDYIDITPAGSRGASVRAMTAETQVGFSKFGNRTYAALWHNTAESFINLAPPEAYYSTVAATTGEVHVGWARILDVGDHACAWISDSPDGFIDLHPSLGPNYVASDARAVSREGNVITVVGTALATSGRLEAVMWTATVPAPGVLALASLAGLLAARRKR